MRQEFSSYKEKECTIQKNKKGEAKASPFFYKFLIGVKMIKITNEISNEDGYSRYNFFEIHPDLEAIVHKDYQKYATEEFDRKEYCENKYKENFYDKYDKDAYKEVYEKYIDNEKFKEKAMFIYSIIDYDKYKEFVKLNPTIENPSELIISYSVLDNSGVKVNIYNISISDISFVF